VLTSKTTQQSSVVELCAVIARGAGKVEVLLYCVSGFYTNRKMAGTCAVYVNASQANVSNERAERADLTLEGHDN